MQNVVSIAADWWLTWLFGIIAAALVCRIRGVKNKQQAHEARQDALEVGVQALLRGEIVRTYDKYFERGSITLHGLEAVDKLYSAYHGLGGNGSMTKLVADMKQLEVKD